MVPLSTHYAACSWCQVRQYWWAHLPRPLEQPDASLILRPWGGSAFSWKSTRSFQKGLTLPPLQELVSRLLHLHFRDSKTKVSGDALQLMVEFLRIFVVEAAVRGVRQAQAEGAVLVDVDQLEKVLPQLLLDF
ncbi:centromere protein X isoform X3 [Marmota marmota marmota]|uniref:centromere protein X isoform X3 n=1 Tax=Marmota marmota marmota TaxID=9994 RepID=UPI0020933763|nr:centromere protein X isoform X3 [Marmota marmota marmota]